MKRKVIIDADYLLYAVYPDTGDESETIGEVDIKDGIDAFNNLVDELMDTLQESKSFKVKKKPRLIISDETNFRYSIFPDYKCGRTAKRSREFYALREWARGQFTVWKNCEADDVCGWYARFKTEKVVIVSMDKDVKYSLPGVKFDPYHSRREWLVQSEEEAAKFTLLQTLAGDPGDGIPGVKGVGFKTAGKLLNTYGWDWAGVVRAYESKGYSEKDAILTRRLVGLDQLNKQKEIELWNPSK